MINDLFSDSPLYPEQLKVISGNPQHLHYLGEWPISTGTFCIGIVGSRRVSHYGIRVLRELFYNLKGSNVVIISGFTVGVDSVAHTLALDSGLQTIAVMPCGADIIHPADNRELYNRIINGGGCILSEYDNGFYPKKWTYPKRNRIIAALSGILLVVEASLKSGSMITASYAVKYKKKVFAVPGDIYNDRSAGTNSLIKETALIYTTPRDITKCLSSYSEKIVSLKPAISEDETLVLEAMSAGNCDVVALSLYTGFTYTQLTTILLRMVVKNMIEERDGLYCVL